MLECAPPWSQPARSSVRSRPKDMRHLSAEDDRAARYQTVALHALAKLSAGDVRPKTVHRLRTHLRRLQAYLELVGEDRNAEIMANCASRLSSFRTLQVFERYLTRLRAAPSDIRKVKDCIRKKRLKLDQSVLGDYEERAQFRKLARALHLKSYARILKDWRRAKTRARTLPAKLTGLIDALTGRGLRLVESGLPSNRTTSHELRLAMARYGVAHPPA